MEKFVEQYYDFYFRSWKRRYLFLCLIFGITVSYGLVVTFGLHKETVIFVYGASIIVLSLLGALPLAGSRIAHTWQTVRPTETSSEPSEFGKLGIVLAGMAEYVERSIEDEARWRPVFLSILKKVVEAFSDRLTVYKTLVRLADESNWPAWAVRSLPGLYAELETRGNGQVVGYISRYVLGGMPPSCDYSVIEELCGGEIFKVIMPLSTAHVAKKMSDDVATYLRNNPNESDRAFLGTVITLWSEDEYRSRCTDDISAAEKLRVERERVLVGENVMANAF
jgi:hypothetical protein